MSDDRGADAGILGETTGDAGALGETAFVGETAVSERSGVYTGGVC